MSYIGESLKGKPLPHLDFARTALVLVTGSAPNTCGHILLYVGGGFGNYFHFDGPSLFDYPKYMTQAQYSKFLIDEGKRELMRKWVSVPHPDRATQRLRSLMDGKWFSFLASHNCATFASEVLNAGGNFYDMPSHCPTLDMLSSELIERVFGPLRQKLGTQEAYETQHLR